MGKRAEDYIPENILASAKNAGLNTPLWYAGGQNNPNYTRKKTFEDLIAEAAKATTNSRMAEDVGGVSVDSELHVRPINEQE
jgi:hypothetical protein